MKNLIKIALFAAALSSVSCETRTYEEISESTPLPAMVTFTQDIKPIIDNNCVVCHSPNGASAFFPLTDYTLIKNAIDDILDRIQRPAGDPLKMPQGGSLSPAQIEIIKKWKTDGLQQ
ncbi:c-type cytochrome [Chryseobacterium sp.]|uniref:c-type cytochrome n=1 Tax=Chryseobacterium sp. TaxID=1871047 RepID=UPI0011CA1B7B|nr:cytochrome c [Chryseobacterium sp.]TXF77334.1 cytochrome c [Chryseobacterium sp.]